MSYTAVNYRDIDDKSGLYFLREPLSCTELGLSVIDVEDGRSGPPHDHAADGEEEVYLLVEGHAELTVGDETIHMEAGDAVRVDPEATRQVTVVGDSQLVIVGAP